MGVLCVPILISALQLKCFNLYRPYFLTVTNKCTLAKVLFVTPTCFGQSGDHLQGVVQYGYKQYVSDYMK